MIRRAGYLNIEDYALIGDSYSCALVGKDASIDWACFPRFDSPSVFGRLLDHQHCGFFQISPASNVQSLSRSYVSDTNVLQTRIATEAGHLAITDFMPVHGIHEERLSNRIIRIVECTSGTADVFVHC